MPFDQPPLVSIAYPNVYYAAPLLGGLGQRGDLELTDLLPAELPEATTRGHHTCLLLAPSLLLQSEKYLVLPGTGVSAEGITGSERLVSGAPLESISQISVHPNAHHLISLLQILFLERGLALPSLGEFDENASAVLYSGNEGQAKQEQSGHDLGALWRESTDLPLVLGVWACGPGAPYRMLRSTLGGAARAMGDSMAGRDESAPLLHYELLSRESDSLRLFNALAIRHHLVESSEEAISFC